MGIFTYKSENVPIERVYFYLINTEYLIFKEYFWFITTWALFSQVWPISCVSNINNIGLIKLELEEV